MLQQIILATDSEIWMSIYAQRYLLRIYSSDTLERSKTPSTKECLNVFQYTIWYMIM